MSEGAKVAGKEAPNVAALHGVEPTELPEAKDAATPYGEWKSADAKPGNTL